MVGPQMAPDIGMGAVQLVVLLGMMPKDIEGLLLGFDTWGELLTMVPVQLVATVV